MTMLRRGLLAFTSLALIGALTVVLVGPASSATRRADVTVSDLGEPPDFSSGGSSFRVPFSVANMGNFRAGRLTVQRFSATRFFLDQDPDNAAGRIRVGQSKVSGIAVNSETSRRARLRIPATIANGGYFLVACADANKKVRESRERNNCRISGQAVVIGLGNQLPQGPPGPRGSLNQFIIDRFTLDIGRGTITGAEPARSGDEEKSTQRRQFVDVGGVQLVADCKRTSNGDDGEPDAAFTSDFSFDQNGDEAKVLVYTNTTGGTITFNSLGQSARKNIPPGEGASVEDQPTAGSTQADDTVGGEGKHQAIAAARDPDQVEPEEDEGFAYKVGTIFIHHTNGTQLLFTGYAGVDVFGAEDKCVFGGVLKVLKQGA